MNTFTPPHGILAILIFVVSFFTSMPMQAQTIQIDSLFTTDGEIFPFGPNDTIYGLSISGHVTLSSDTSLVRVILTDNSGNEWMVYEAYPLISPHLEYEVSEVSDETMYRQIFFPASLKIQLINASFDFDAVLLQNTYNVGLGSLQSEFKLTIQSRKVDSINYFIKTHQMLWFAHQNPVSDLSFTDKSKRFGEKYNLLGLDYYTGGIYDGIPGSKGPKDDSELTDAWDWRNRHGANDPNKSAYYFDSESLGCGWLTSVKNQNPFTCDATCYIYGPLAAIEGVANLYYNQHIDYDLSEQQVLDCDDDYYEPNWPDCQGHPAKTSQLVRDLGVMDEVAYPRESIEKECRSEQPPNEPAHYWIKISDYHGYTNFDSETLKVTLINHGPIEAIIANYSEGPHSLALVGYGKIKENDIFYDPIDFHTSIIVGHNSDYIGKLYWIFKNSWGDDCGDAGYFNFLDEDTDINQPLYYEVPVENILPNQDTIQAYDKDHDGYWNWGISENYTLPEGVCSGLKDSDDSENRIGPFDSKYDGMPVKPEIEVVGTTGQITPITNHGFYFFDQNNVTLTFQITNPGSANLHLIEFGNSVTVSGPDAGHFINIIQPDKTEICFDGNKTSVFSMQFTTEEIERMHEAHLTIAIKPLDKDVLEDFEFELVYHGCDYNGGNLTVNTYYPIYESEYQLMSGDIYIERGGIMEVFGSLAMYPESDIYVEPGGQLKINGGLITGIVGNCKSIWHGIDIWGDPLQPQNQYVQGLVNLINGGCIEYAEIGIETAYHPDARRWKASGGIISCYDAVFKDNLMDIKFYPYNYTHPITHQLVPNISSFTKTIFETTEDLYKFNFGVPTAHILMNQVGGIRYTACTFGNYSTFHTGSRGVGIESYGSGYFVSYGCAEEGISPCPSTSILPCRFENLDYGIRSFNNYGFYNVSISTADFIHNRRGIYLGAVNNAVVIRNTFDISDPEHLHPNDTLVGLYLDAYTTGFLVEENSFTGPSTFSKTVGVHLMNTGTNQNEIYNNIFTTLKQGIMAVGTNRLSPIDLQDPGKGLCIKCNDFSSCNNDVWVTPVIINGISYITQNTGIARQQGELGNGSKTKSAGNTFSNLSSCTYYNAQYCGHIDYTYLNGENSPDNVVPLHTSGDITLIGDDDADYSKAESCPSHLGGSITLSIEKNNLINETSLIEAYQDTLLMTIDGGNTEGLNYEVLTSFPEEALVIRQELMEKSPYLSDTVMISAIGKEEVLPRAMVRDILVSNPQAPKSIKIMNALDQRQDTIPDYMMDEIMQGMNTFGAKELLEQKLGSHKVKKEKALTNINLFYKNDTANWNNGIDSLIALYENQNKLSDKYELAFLFLDKSDSTNTFGILNSIPGEFVLDEQELLVHDQYQDVFEILWDTKNDSIGLDSLQIQNLLEMSSVSNNLPGIFASNLLIKQGILIYYEPVYLGEEIVKTVEAPVKKTESENEKSHLKLFPNPAGNYFIASYDLREKESPGLITISDINGKELRALQLKDKQNQIVIPALEFTNGIYLIKLLASNKILNTEKISINR